MIVLDLAPSVDTSVVFAFSHCYRACVVVYEYWRGSDTHLQVPNETNETCFPICLKSPIEVHFRVASCKLEQRFCKCAFTPKSVAEMRVTPACMSQQRTSQLVKCGARTFEVLTCPMSRARFLLVIYKSAQSDS